MFTVNTRITPTEVILSREVEAYVRKNPFRFCDHDGCIIEYDREYRQYTCRTCDTKLLSKQQVLMANFRRDPVDTIRQHLSTSILVQYRKSKNTEEVTPESYKNLAEQQLIDVLRFPPVTQESDDWRDAMRYAASAYSPPWKRRH
jgi:hypothetical protein